MVISSFGLSAALLLSTLRRFALVLTYSLFSIMLLCTCTTVPSEDYERVEPAPFSRHADEYERVEPAQFSRQFDDADSGLTGVRIQTRATPSSRRRASRSRRKRCLQHGVAYYPRTGNSKARSRWREEHRSGNSKLRSSWKEEHKSGNNKVRSSWMEEHRSSNTK